MGNYLKLIGSPLSDDDYMTILMHRFAAKHRGVFNALAANKDKPTLDYVISQITADEILMKKGGRDSQLASPPESASAAFTAKKYCSYHKKEGHSTDECRTLKWKQKQEVNNAANTKEESKHAKSKDKNWKAHSKRNNSKDVSKTQETAKLVSKSTEDNTEYLFMTSDSDLESHNDRWYMDSCCSSHMTTQRDILSDFEEIPPERCHNCSQIFYYVSKFYEFSFALKLLV
jgi:hypothetical protein